MIKVYAKAPTRIDIAGGTVDMSPLSQILDTKMTVNLGVELHAEVWIESVDGDCIFESLDLKRKVSAPYKDIVKTTELVLFSKLLKYFWDESLPAVHIKTKAKSPAGAGLGGSSCLSVAIVGALLKAREQVSKKIELTDNEFIQKIQDIETSVIKVPTGCQDYWGGYRGGLNLLSYEPGATKVETYKDDRVREFAKKLMLVFCGKSRDSGINNWEVFKSAFDGDPKVLRCLNEIGSIAMELGDKAIDGKWDEVIRLSKKEWEVRKDLCPGIETLETKAIDNAATQAGAEFTRICGAGGGGVMAVFVEPEYRDAVAKACISAGGSILDAGIDMEGLVVRAE